MPRKAGDARCMWRLPARVPTKSDCPARQGLRESRDLHVCAFRLSRTTVLACLACLPAPTPAYLPACALALPTFTLRAACLLPVFLRLALQVADRRAGGLRRASGRRQVGRRRLWQAGVGAGRQARQAVGSGAGHSCLTLGTLGRCRHPTRTCNPNTKACIEILKCMCKVGDVKAQSISLPEDLDLDESD